VLIRRRGFCSHHDGTLCDVGRFCHAERHHIGGLQPRSAAITGGDAGLLVELAKKYLLILTLCEDQSLQAITYSADERELNDLFAVLQNHDASWNFVLPDRRPIPSQ